MRRLPLGSSGEVRGTVVEFDEHRGTGIVHADDGAEYFLHSTCIAGGSRTIATGAPVRFRVAPGHLGHWEARDVRPA